MSRPALILFLALFGLYSPVAALASYLPIATMLLANGFTDLVTARLHH